MDFLRQLVGGPKKRFKEFGYNLDLTYITERVIAMAFPASGFEKLYRNSVDSIQQFLENSHQNKYITINISGRSIEHNKLQNVISYDWQDHKAPSFELLFIICDQVAAFLAADIDRIAVFHCNHGKGRTGTIICCFFLFLGLFKQTNQVMKFYASRRFQTEGYGVTQPCQIKYIQYFRQLIYNPILYPKILKVQFIQFQGQFNFQQPYIKILQKDGKETIYNSKYEGDIFQRTSNGLKLNINHQFPLAGDIVIELKDNKSVGKNLLVNYVFNTAFIDSKKEIRAQLKDLSPLGKQKSGNFGSSFQVSIHIQTLCQCGQIRNITGCNKCHGVMKGLCQKWDIIQSIITKRQVFAAKGKQLAFGKFYQ